MATDALGHVCIQLIKCAIELCEKYNLVNEVFRPPCLFGCPVRFFIFLPCAHRGSLQATNLKNAWTAAAAAAAAAYSSSRSRSQLPQPQPQPHTAAHGQNHPQQFPQAQGQLQPRPAHLASSAPIATAVQCI